MLTSALHPELKDDSKTTVIDETRTLTAKDIAINGDLEDLASARGIFYKSYLPWHPEKTQSYWVVDFNNYTKPGVYHINWREGTTSTDADGREVQVALNHPNTGNGTAYWFDGILEVDVISPNTSISSYTRVQQKVTISNVTPKIQGQSFIRSQTSANPGGIWQDWKRQLDDSLLGDGFKITNGIISVPQYSGASVSTTGTSGLVPPATEQKFAAPLLGTGDFSYEQLGNYIQVADKTLNIFEYSNFISMFTAGSIVINAIPSSGADVYNRCYTLLFEEGGNTVITWPENTMWVDSTNEAPVWGGMPGRKLVVILMIVFRKQSYAPIIFASTIYNEMTV